MSPTRQGVDTVSVIIPTWNSANFLNATLDSVCAQTHPVLEILVCDDASTDTTSNLVATYPDPRVKWLPACDRAGSAGPSRNRGIRAARGSWLAFLDHDDVWYPEKLRLQLAQLAIDGCKASSTEAWRFFPGCEGIERLTHKSACRLDFEELLNCNYVVCSSVLLSRSLIEHIGSFPDHILYTDYAMWLRASCYTEFSFIEEPLVRYRDQPQTSIRNNAVPESQRQLDVLRDFLNWISYKNIASKNDIIASVEQRIRWWDERFATN